MLLVSNFILNAVNSAGQCTIFPFLDQPSNCVGASDRARAVQVPDVLPDEIIRNAEERRAVAAANAGGAEEEEEGGPPPFSMAAGEFLVVYGGPEHEGAWDAVVTCFFIDTAPVVFDYIDAIKRLLKPGGVWINLGPLLYHWVSQGDEDEGDARYGQSVELSWEELRHVIGQQGFALEVCR